MAKIASLFNMRDTRLKITLQSAGRRILRWDQPAKAASETIDKHEGHRWFQLLRRAIRSAKKEQRLDVRQIAVEHEIWVGWWSDDHFGAVNGYLDNISRGGALIILNTKPPKGQPIWIYKELCEAMTCVRAEAVGVVPAPNGSYAVRFRFALPCPAVLRESAVCGQSSVKEHSSEDALEDDGLMC